MQGKALAIANNDMVYLWWTYEGKIPGCLGFTIRRLQEGKKPQALPAFVGFQADGIPLEAPVKRPTTDYWPIQSYQWKDLFVPEEEPVSYEIIPMTGTPGKKLKEIPGLVLRTNKVTATDKLGRHRVIFNRGIISSQALSKKLLAGESGTPSAYALRKHIDKPGDPIRQSLAGEAIEALTSLLKRAQDKGGKCYCALYELADKELADVIAACKGRVEVILANANGSKQVTQEDGTKKTKTVYDGTNAKNRKALRKALGDDLHDRLLKGNHIGHNKFVVYVSPTGKPQAVTTGSTNWTPTGLCAQTNNVVILEDKEIAARFLDYWNRLLDDEAEQGADLRTSGAVAPPDQSLGSQQEHARIWFSPNTQRRSKPKDNPPTPPDMAEVFQLIENAKQGVLFLLFSAGRPSILQHINEVARQRKEDGEQFFVRGAVSDAKTSKEFTTRVYNDSILKGPNKLITGIAGVPDQYSYWEKELAKLGHAVIHDKLLVVDPFGDDCVVVTGSHNLGYKASYANDENLCILRGNRAMAHAFTAHVLDVVNHFNWRHKLTEARRKGVSAEKAYYFLSSGDAWQNKYFRGSFLESRDLFFFPQ